MDGIKEKKALLREKILAQRTSAEPEALIELSEKIRLRLELHPLWQQCNYACIYINSKPGEVTTTRLIESALSSGKRVCVPVIEKQTDELQLVEIDSLAGLAPGRFGILEPASGERHRVEAVAFDLVIAPGIAFDHQGRRIGFGKGYYDKLLSARNVPAIALAFAFQIVDPFPTHQHDIPMNMIVTEKEIILPTD